MVRKLRRKPKRRPSPEATTGRNETRTFVLDETHHKPRYRDFSTEEEPTRVKKEWVPQAVKEALVAQDDDASLLLIGEHKVIDSRMMHEAGLYLTAHQYTRREGIEARDDVHEEDRHVHQRMSFASNRFTSSGIDDISQDSESDSGVELEYDKYDKHEQEASRRSSYGLMDAISSMFGPRSSKRALTDTTLEESFDDSDSEKAPRPEMKTVEFMPDIHLEEATSTISESTDEDSNASNLDTDEENDNEDRENSEDEDDDLFEDGLFNGYDDGWNDRMANLLCTCR